jgi:hypothetical protein
VTWEKRVLDLFDDLEQQAEGLALAERDATVAELGAAEYAEVDLSSRLHASRGAVVQLHVLGTGMVGGRLERAGEAWCLVADRANPSLVTVVRTAAVAAARGLSPGAMPDALRGVAARLGVGSVLREIAESREVVAVGFVDGAQRRGRIARVGSDFVELVVDDGPVEVVALAALALVRRG